MSSVSEACLAPASSVGQDEYGPDVFYNYDPAVLAAFIRLRERNPCGYEPDQQNDDVGAVSLASTGHYPMLERTAPQLRALVATWLSRRGFSATSPSRSPVTPTVASALMDIPRRTVLIGRDRLARVHIDCRGPTGAQCAGTLRLDPA